MKTARPGPGAGGDGAKTERKEATLNSNAAAAAAQAIAERDIYRGRDFVGVVRELGNGSFVAVIGENVLGPHPTVKAATDALLDLARPRAEP